MKPSKKTDRKPPVEEKVVHAKKHMDKPWRMEYMIIDEKYVERYWGSKKPELNVWNRQIYYKYLSLEHALQQINKDARSSNWRNTPYHENYRFNYRKFRLINLETEEIIPLVIKTNEIVAEEQYAEREEEGDPAGSPG